MLALRSATVGNPSCGLTSLCVRRSPGARRRVGVGRPAVAGGLAIGSSFRLVAAVAFHLVESDVDQIAEALAKQHLNERVTPERVQSLARVSSTRRISTPMLSLRCRRFLACMSS